MPGLDFLMTGSELRLILQKLVEFRPGKEYRGRLGWRA
jgi:hypothetical protein